MRYLFLIIVFSIINGILPKPAFAVEKSAQSSAMLVSKKPEPKFDNRTRVIERFLSEYNSPLTPHASTFVKTSDTYDLDYRLLVAISGVESTFGKEIPPNSFNGWGWGIYGDNRIYFSSWNEAIETISKGLRERYMDTWKASNVYEIGRFYAASPTWATRVDYFMNKITAFEVNNPDLALPISL